MASFFISHASADLSAAEQLRERLRAWGYVSLFLDADPDDGIPTGSDWERELYARLRMADAVIFLGSPAAVASRWCFAELAMARSRGTPVLPLWLGGNGRGDVLVDRQWLNVADGFEPLRKTLEERFDGRVAYQWDPRRSPYPGLAAFQAEHAAVFFGRDDKIAEVLRHLDPGAESSVAVIGASGTGKSSLVRAGVLPRLASWSVIGPFTPGERPVVALARALADVLDGDRTALQDRIERDPRELAELLRDIADGRPSLVVVDQFEELVTLAEPNERERFAELLSGPVRVLATLRSAFLERSLRDAGLDGLIDDTVLLGPLDRSRLPEVIVAPARRADVEFAPGLVERMVEDTRGGDALPLLAYTLEQLYAGGAAEDRLITHAEYDAIGGVPGALVRRATEVASRLGTAPVIPTLLELTTLDAEGAPTRRPLPLERLTPEQRRVADAFVDAHLLTIDGQVLSVAHEALLRVWPPLRDAVAASREQLRVRAELTRLAREWDDAGRDDAYLLHGTRLRTVGEVLGEPPAGLEGEFYAASLALDARTRAAERRRRRRTLIGLSVAVAVLAIAAVVSVRLAAQARQAQDEAETQARTALVRQLIAESNAALTEDRAGSLRFALSADGLVSNAQARAALFNGLTSEPALVKTYPGLGARILALHADARSDRLLALDERGRVLSRRLSGGDARVLFTAAAARPAVFSPDGTLLAVADANPARIRLWNVSTHKKLAAVQAPGYVVNTLRFTANGRILASQSQPGAQLWHVGSRVRPLAVGQRLKRRLVTGRAMPSFDGRLLALSDDTGLSLVELPSGRVRYHVPGVQFSTVRGFAPDGRTVWGSDISQARLTHVDMASGRRGDVPSPVTAGSQFTFSPDARVAAVTLSRGRAMILDARTGDVVAPDPGGGHTGALAFDTREPVLYTGTSDGTITAWRLKEGSSIVRRRAVDSDIAVFSPDGRQYAVGSLSGTRHVLAVLRADGTGVARGMAGARGYDPIGFDARGTRLLATSDDDTKVFDVASRTSIYDSVPDAALALAPDGRTVAVFDDNGGIALLNLETRQQQVLAKRGYEGFGNAIRFSREGRALTLDVDDRLVRLRAGSAQPVTLARNITAASLDADGDIAAVQDTSGALWIVRRTAAGVKRTRLASEFTPIALSADGRWLAAVNGAGDGLGLWDLRERQRFAMIAVDPGRAPYGPQWSAEFVPGREILALLRDNKLEQWDFSLRTMKAQACAASGGELAEPEWKRLVGRKEPYRRVCR